VGRADQHHAHEQRDRQDAWASDPYFGGNLDEFAFYNKTLTGAQIRYHYDLGVARGTLLDRANPRQRQLGIELRTPDNVTLDHLNVTGRL